MADQACPFCKSTALLPVENSQGKHWMYCTNCGASGPHALSAESAAAAFTVNVSVAASLLSRWTRKEKPNG